MYQKRYTINKQTIFVLSFKNNPCQRDQLNSLNSRKMNFDALTDEQLLELFRSILSEIAQRGGATESAAREIALSEKEKTEIISRATEREARRMREEEAERIAREVAEKLRAEQKKAEAEKEAAKVAGWWKTQKKQSQMLFDLLGSDDLYVSVWSRDGKGLSDKRVYLKSGDYFNGKEIAVFYHHGNGKNAPKSIETSNLKKYLPEGKDFAEYKEELRIVLETISTAWNNCKFNVKESLSAQVA